ncbi:MAG: DUF560 domain-containing protein [Halioglobus sp.]|nr:DUF560 domain-containing protein [Halioglobus sp.]
MRRPPQTASLPLAAALGALLGVSAAQAAPATPRSVEYAAEVGIGTEYDSNVSVEEVDRTSNEGDYALNLDLGVEVSRALSDQVDIAATYDLSQTLYREFDEVDRQTHILGADVSLDAGAVDSGVSLFYINSRLDGSRFLELYRLSPYLSGFLSRRWFARGAYVYSEKAIADRPERDATTHAAEADLYYFRRGLRSYFNVGYRFRNENARTDRLDYRANSLKLRYIHRFDVFSRLAKLELAWRYEDRDYRSVTPVIQDKRRDERHRWRADLEVPLTVKAAVQFYYSYGDYDSNYTPADYSQHLLGTRLVYLW